MNTPNRPAKPIYKFDDFPKPKENSEFWKFLEDPHYKININFLLINEARKYQPETLNDAQCRTQLARMKVLQEMLDLPDSIKANQEEPLPPEQEGPLGPLI